MGRCKRCDLRRIMAQLKAQEQARKKLASGNAKPISEKAEAKIEESVIVEGVKAEEVVEIVPEMIEEEVKPKSRKRKKTENEKVEEVEMVASAEKVDEPIEVFSEDTFGVVVEPSQEEEASIIDEVFEENANAAEEDSEIPVSE